jgi:hypothetical protein
MVRLREIARSISVADLPGAVEIREALSMSERWMVMAGARLRVWAEENPAAAGGIRAEEEMSMAGTALSQWRDR